MKLGKDQRDRQISDRYSLDESFGNIQKVLGNMRNPTKNSCNVFSIGFNKW